ncbi:hypothetical protein HYT84_02940 [Candidatus Micrarchaeota archaeon]|nr:hypothetical protein [Candidatus Micrarchaeota archaeon]
MKKEDILKIAVVLTVLFFIFEPIAIGIIGRANLTPTNQSTSSQIQGAIQFNATLESYDPYLLITTLNSDQKDSIKQVEGVEDIISIDNGYAISLKKSQDIPKVYSDLKKLNITSYANANLQMPDSVEITAGLTILETVSTGGSLIKMVTEPLIAEGETVELRMSASAQNGFLASYSAPSFVPKSSPFEVDANVLS